MALGDEVVLPRRRLVRRAARTSDREHGRPRLLGTGVPLHVHVADEDDGPCGRVDGLVVEREGCPAGQHDVHLFVAEGALRVLLDDVVARIGRHVRVDPERSDVERSPDRPPQKRAVHDRDRLDLVQADALPPLCHA